MHSADLITLRLRICGRKKVYEERIWALNIVAEMLEPMWLTFSVKDGFQIDNGCDDE